jgi:hypothetical protein
MSDETNKRLSSLLFVALAEKGGIDDASIMEYGVLFPTWDANWTGKAGTILRDEGKLYRSIHDVTNIAQNTKPSITPSMWTQIGDPSEEYPEWFPPKGAHDVYTIGDKVSHNGKKWINELYEANSWEPGVFGWTEVVE